MPIISAQYKPQPWSAYKPALLKEQKFEVSGVTSDKDAAKAGQILNVPAVMLINIPDYKEEKMSMTAKIVNVEDAALLWAGSGSGSTGKTLSTILGAAAGAAVGASVGGHDRTDRTIGGIAGGVLGGVAGRAGPENHKKGLRNSTISAPETD